MKYLLRTVRGTALFLLCPALPCFMLALLSAQTHADNTDTDCQKVKELRQSLSEQRKDRDSTYRDLGRIAADIQIFQKKIAKSKNSINASKSDLQELRTENRDVREQFLLQSQKTAEILRLSHRLGPIEGLQLLLRLEEPELLTRMRAYSDYLHRAREKQLSRYRGDYRKFLQAEEQQQKLVAQLLKQGQEVDKYHAELQLYHAEQDQALDYHEQQVTRLEKELGLLLETIYCETKGDVFYGAPFEQLKGNLQLPTRGEVIHRFGEAHTGGRLHWQGVWLQAESGAPVHAVHNGKIVFSDWFGSLGLLLAIDHGSDYLSLYANNQSILRSTGSEVGSGEIIATIGYSDNIQTNGLYFELRYQGKAIDPALWWDKSKVKR